MGNVYIAFNKPFYVMSQFKPIENKKTLLDYIQIPEMPKAVGRLDYDSEGLLLLSNNSKFLYKMTHPNNHVEKEYIVQVENIPKESDLIPLKKGLKTISESYLPCKIEIIPEPNFLWERNPPIRFRKNIPTSWLRIILKEGKNRQVRKMTAFIGFPTLRLIRLRIDNIPLGDLQPGQFKYL